jgi:methyltransferase (TIGR00027 family)
MRTCIIDDFIRCAIAEGIDTIVNLGAGLDARPYRMDLPASVQWIEADYPRLIDYKERLLANEQPRCRLERVKIDLADLAARRRLFARIDSQAQRILVLTEGVVPYLSLEEAGSLADDLRALEHLRYWLLDYFSAETMKFRNRRNMNRKMQNAPFRFAPADWFGFFGQHGWASKSIRYLADEGERTHRPIPLPWPMKAMMKLLRLFAPKERRDAMRKFAGYVLLEPR